VRLERGRGERRAAAAAGGQEGAAAGGQRADGGAGGAPSRGAGFVCSLHLAGGCKCLRTMPLQAPYPVGCLQAPCKQLQHEWHQTNVC